MAAPPIPLGLIGTGLAVEKLHWPAMRKLVGRYVVTAFTDSSTEQSRLFADHSGVGPARATGHRATLLARDDGTESVLVPAGSSSERRVTRSGSDPTTHTTVFRGTDNGYRVELVDFADAGLFDGLPGQRINSSASFAA